MESAMTASMFVSRPGESSRQPRREWRSVWRSYEDPFDVVYRWRNSSLHGQASLPTIRGTVFNTAILVALDAISADYDSMRDRALENVELLARDGSLIAVSYSSAPIHLRDGRGAGRLVPRTNDRAASRRRADPEPR
jgi:hypothetical protein